ncbi:hypothetical protein KKG85_01155 [Patescibacteria group bacterium]|nr:hypothetical protein [Patescibacteria group bacterium]MBU2579654.1 hypothetical protein [Patescibacteria group bacterium]
MKAKTVVAYGFVGAAVVSAILGIIVVATFYLDTTKTANTELQKPQEKQERLYKDDGLGIMTIYRHSHRLLREGYAQWKKDYPEREDRIIDFAIHGLDKVGLVLLYKTE